MKEDGLDKERAILIATSVIKEKVEEAPSFNEPTDKTNSKWPSYTTWSIICYLADLDNLFYEKNDEFYEFKGGHPGYFYLTKEWIDELNSKIEKFKINYPNTSKVDNPEVEISYQEIEYLEDGKKHTYLAKDVTQRLDWLSFWCNYAYDKYYDETVFYNS